MKCDVMLVLCFASHRYSFAIVGINITDLAYNLLVSGALKTHFYNIAPEAPTLSHFQQTFCKCLLPSLSRHVSRAHPEKGWTRFLHCLAGFRPLNFPLWFFLLVCLFIWFFQTSNNKTARAFLLYQMYQPLIWPKGIMNICYPLLWYK